MRRKKLSIEKENSKLIFSDECIKISRNEKNYFFELSNEITTDIAEAVSMMMMMTLSNDDKIWNLPIDNVSDCVPEKSLYWLTGGTCEWETLNNYTKPWCVCCLDFQKEFGTTIVNIVEKAKKLSDIRDSFNRYLDLPTLYDFALSKSII
jgi:hypothetical protein